MSLKPIEHSDSGSTPAAVDPRSNPDQPVGTLPSATASQRLPRSRQRVTVTNIQITPKTTEVHKVMVTDNMHETWVTTTTEKWLEKCAPCARGGDLEDDEMKRFKQELKKYTSLFPDTRKPSGRTSQSTQPAQAAANHATGTEESAATGDGKKKETGTSSSGSKGKGNKKAKGRKSVLEDETYSPLVRACQSRIAFLY